MTFTADQLRRIIFEYGREYNRHMKNVKYASQPYWREKWQEEADACKALVEAARAELQALRDTEGK